MGAELVIVSVPGSVPELPGEYVIVAVQLAPAATSPQLFACENLALDIVALMNVTFADVLLV